MEEDTQQFSCVLFLVLIEHHKTTSQCLQTKFMKGEIIWLQLNAKTPKFITY